jgi:hypothetical protein
MTAPALAWLAFAWLALAAAPAMAAVEVEGVADGGTELRQGEEVVLAVTDEAGDPRSGETVRVIHRPGLAGETELAIGISDGRGRVRWTPEVSGVARLRAGEEEAMIRIVPTSPPIVVVVTLGLLLLTSAGALGHGGWGHRLRRAGRRIS